MLRERPHAPRITRAATLIDLRMSSGVHAKACGAGGETEESFLEPTGREVWVPIGTRRLRHGFAVLGSEDASEDDPAVERIRQAAPVESHLLPFTIEPLRIRDAPRNPQRDLPRDRVFVNARIEPHGCPLGRNRRAALSRVENSPEV